MRRKKEGKISEDIIGSFYPERRINGFTSVDGTIAFYNQVNALMTNRSMVLDYGAGRAAWYEDDSNSYRRALRTLKGKVNKVIACDIDSAVHDNRAADKTVQISAGRPLPFDDGEFDIVVADYVFEHITEPSHLASELARVIKPNGVLCARTPNKWGYVSLLTRLIKNKYHTRVLRYAQPNRKEVDVFPTTFMLNTPGTIAQNFPNKDWVHSISYYEAEPAYFFGKKPLFFIMYYLNRLLPRSLNSTLFIFLRRR